MHDFSIMTSRQSGSPIGREGNFQTTHGSIVVEFFYNARFVATRFGNSLADVGFVMYQNELTHVIIGFKHNAPCIVRSEALRGHSHTSVHEVLRQCTRRVH